MDDVEKLLTSALVQIRPASPTHPDAKARFRRYFAELDRRSESGFDPAQGVSAEPHELRPPAGLLLVAYLREEPIGCGAVKHHDEGPSEIKRALTEAISLYRSAGYEEIAAFDDEPFAHHWFDKSLR